MDEQKDTTEEQEFIESLNSSFYKVGKRSTVDRHREFRNIFLGTDEGRRVLYEILSMAKLSAINAPEIGDIDTKRMLLNEGKRHLAAAIINVVHKEPKTDKPKQAQSRLRQNIQ